MSFQIPTTQESFDQLLANIEARINQTSPLLARAFNRVIAGSVSLVITGLYKFGAERTKQSLALTATGDDLKRIGADRGVIDKKAVAAVVTVDVTGTNGINIPSTISWVAASNGLRYFAAADIVIAAGIATLSLTCEETGAVGNLNNGETLSISAQISGAATIATVTGTTTTGADEEEQETYRARVLTAQRVTTGGGNAADYRIWSEETEGVRRAYPYAGQPIGSSVTSEPPERTVYVEAQTSIDPDGVAPPTLLDDVRDSITTDPETGFERQPLGLTNETLFVESITRLSVFVGIQGLSVDPSKETQAKSDINDALDLYFAKVIMFVSGLDFEGDKNDTLSIASIGGVVDDALRATGGSAITVLFGFDALLLEVRYQLRPGELVKRGPITYV